MKPAVMSTERLKMAWNEAQAKAEAQIASVHCIVSKTDADRREAIREELLARGFDEDFLATGGRF